MIDVNIPHEQLRVRVHGGFFVAQPYAGEQRCGEPLIINMDTGMLTSREYGTATMVCASSPISRGTVVAR